MSIASILLSHSIPFHRVDFKLSLAYHERMEDIKNALTKGVVLAELGGHGDGPYCASHGKNATLVVMGTYIVDPGDSVPYPEHFVFKPGRKQYSPYLKEHISEARKSGAAVGISIVCIKTKDEIDFLQAAEEAGVDFISLCLHSTMSMFVDVGLSSALLHRENREVMRKRVKEVLDATTRPLIIKMGTAKTKYPVEAVKELTDLGVPIIHANVPKSPEPRNTEIIHSLKEHSPWLIVGGGIQNTEDAEAVIQAGADAVSVGKAAMEDPHLCGRLTKHLQQG